MGRDKALLPHPEGGTWLERSLRLLAGLQLPITLLSRWPEHLALAAGLEAELGHPPLELLQEPAPQEGPLLALHRLMERYPGERLLLCPVDMPHLTQDVLQQLLAASTAAPSVIQLTHDGERCQPLLAIYPGGPAQRRALAATIQQGERRLQGWLNSQTSQSIQLPATALRNVNRPEELQQTEPMVNVPAGAAGVDQPRDQLHRPLGVLRLSLTARCNLACPYCLPDGQEPPGLLSLEQRLAVVEAAVALGASSLRLTGGEPLLHPELEALIAALQPLRQRGLREIALTSNGQLLTAERARRLRAAGLDRLTLSLDGADGASVALMAGLADAGAGAQALERVLAAIDHARAAGFDPAAGALKLNAVIQRGRNDDQLLPLAELARRRGVELRLIEYMDVGTRNGWNAAEVVSAAELVDRIAQHWPLLPQGRPSHGTASRWHYRDGAGALAVVASVSQPFCGDCNRLRVTADGIAYTCLFATAGSGVDLKPWLAAANPAAALRQGLSELWRQRTDRYSEERPLLRSSAVAPSHSEMAYLGG